MCLCVHVCVCVRVRACVHVYVQKIIEISTFACAEAHARAHRRTEAFLFRLCVPRGPLADEDLSVSEQHQGARDTASVEAEQLAPD